MAEPDASSGGEPPLSAGPREPRRGSRRRIRPADAVVPVLITLLSVALAVGIGALAWDYYVRRPWTRDGTVRAYVVTMAPEVAGRIVQLPVHDNQLVHKGQLLMVIDPTDYRIAVQRAEAAVRQAHIDAQNAHREASRRERLARIDAVPVEQMQSYQSTAIGAQAQETQAMASLEQARVNLQRTRIVSPVNGWVTNLLVRQNDFATVGQNELSVVDAGSFWIDAYFEETRLHEIHEGDPARIKLMGYRDVIRGHVGSIAHAINVPNAQPNGQGVASTNPIFTWVRLAQRIPVRIEIDEVPASVRLVAGMTATVEIEPRGTSAAARTDTR